jgi:hypothetical protein
MATFTPRGYADDDVRIMAVARHVLSIVDGAGTKQRSV